MQEFLVQLGDHHLIDTRIESAKVRANLVWLGVGIKLGKPAIVPSQHLLDLILDADLPVDEHQRVEALS